VVATVTTGTNPHGAAVNPQTNKIYVGNLNSNTVTVIDGATNNTATVAVGQFPNEVAVNPATNKIYVTNLCGTDHSCYSRGTVTVIDGATNNTTTVSVGYYPYGLAVDSVTNKIYVANRTCWVTPCSYSGTVTVIDGATNNTATVNVGVFPDWVRINSVTNKIYVANVCGTDLTCRSLSTVTVIDGTNNNTATVNVGAFPYRLGVNAITNKIYVPNNCGNDPTCKSMGTVTVIDGATNNTSTVNVEAFPYDAEVDPLSNKIYVSNDCGNDLSCGSPGTVTVIDGATDDTTTVDVEDFPYDVSLDPATNNIYVVNSCGTDHSCGSDGTVSVINGTNNSVVSIAVGKTPGAIATNVTTNKIYVNNYADDTVSVIAGATAPALQFVSFTPCRLVDTRNPTGEFGGPPITGNSSRSFPIPQQTLCNVPATAAAYSLNVTVVPLQALGYLTIWPTGEDQPVVSTMNSPDGRVKANAAIVPAGASGAVSVYVTDTSNVILDIDGYFQTPGSQTLQFYPLTPCRLVDTRGANGDLGGPRLPAQTTRTFPLLESSCIPAGLNPLAYSLNFTVVPNPAGQQLGYLTVWPAGETQPVVSTLNNPTATVVANAAIVPAGTNGAIDAYAYNTTDLLIDINGYFATPGQGSYSFYPAAPCRVYDSRNNGGSPFQGERTVNVVGSPCAPPSNATGYVLNATVVPSAQMGYLTLWPDSEPMPVVSTLNAYDGFITSNMAIVPNINGSIDAFAAGLTQLILDISGYFAP
jgi:YVTN family beta-propeller protein